MKSTRFHVDIQLGRGSGLVLPHLGGQPLTHEDDTRLRVAMYTCRRKKSTAEGIFPASTGMTFRFTNPRPGARPAAFLVFVGDGESDYRQAGDGEGGLSRSAAAAQAPTGPVRISYQAEPGRSGDELQTPMGRESGLGRSTRATMLGCWDARHAKRCTAVADRYMVGCCKTLIGPRGAVPGRFSYLGSASHHRLLPWSHSVWVAGSPGRRVAGRQLVSWTATAGPTLACLTPGQSSSQSVPRGGVVEFADAELTAKTLLLARSTARPASKREAGNLKTWPFMGNTLLQTRVYAPFLHRSVSSSAVVLRRLSRATRAYHTRHRGESCMLAAQLGPDRRTDRTCEPG